MLVFSGPERDSFAARGHEEFAARGWPMAFGDRLDSRCTSGDGSHKFASRHGRSFHGGAATGATDDTY
jgi:hypothetical protein